MPEVITWTVGGGLLIFGLGLVSALQARKQNKARPHFRIVERNVTQRSSQNNAVQEQESDLAMVGKGNDPASSHNTASKLVAGQGRNY
jgi:hypothetical protein